MLFRVLRYKCNVQSTQRANIVARRGRNETGELLRSSVFDDQRTRPTSARFPTQQIFFRDLLELFSARTETPSGFVFRDEKITDGLLGRIGKSSHRSWNQDEARRFGTVWEIQEETRILLNSRHPGPPRITPIRGTVLPIRTSGAI